MADLHNILNKFNNLGIVNKGLTVDAPINAPKKESNTEVNPTSHAKQVNESIGNKFIPGVSDTSANDFATLAGVKRSTPSVSMYSENPKPRPAPANPNPNTPQPAWDNVLDRITNIEDKLNKLFETLNPAPWKEKLNESLQMQEADLIIKRPAFNHAMQSAMDDLLWKTTKNPDMIPLVQKLYKMATGKEVEYDVDRDSFTIKAPEKVLSPAEKIIAKSKQPTKAFDSLETEFASFLKELETSKR